MSEEPIWKRIPIRTRLLTYEKETRPLIDYYRAKGLLQEITGDRDVAQLQIELKAILPMPLAMDGMVQQ